MTSMTTRSAVAAEITGRLGGLSPAEAKVARAILEQEDRLTYRSASELAELTGAALSTVVRTCQTLGFKGFQDLKLAVAREGKPASSGEIQGDVLPDDSAITVLAKVAAASQEAVANGASLVDGEAFERAVAALVKARRVLCLGVGTSAPLAQDAAYRLLWLGLEADAPGDPHVQHVRASLVQPGDVALVISHTGSTRETVTNARAARAAGATVVAVTSFPRTPLMEIASVALVAGSKETNYRVEALASRIAHLVVLDALWVAAAVRLGQDSLDTARCTNDVISEHRY